MPTTPLPEFGDYVTGVRVDANTFHALRPTTFKSGTVVGVFPYAPRVVTIQDTEGARFTIKIRA
jgi:hypothetical protein